MAAGKFDPKEIDKLKDEGHSRNALEVGTVLNGVYRVEAELGQGGFGIVYRAHHTELDYPVAIKEYLPAELAIREGRSVHPRSADCREHFQEGMRRFLEEAKQLIAFRNHPNVVSCRDFFRANGTAYLVMEYIEGLPLSELLRAREEEGRPFGEEDLRKVMVPLLEGLRQVHEAGVLHRDIKPGNIMVRRKDERPVLIDFGAAKQNFAEHSKSLAPFTEGYAAIEQVGEGKLGLWTDLYAVGAVMWRMVAGGNWPFEPPNPVKVESRTRAVLLGEADPLPSARELGRGRFSERVLGAIDQCLELREADRVQDCGELLGLLDAKRKRDEGRQKFTGEDGTVWEGPMVNGRRHGHWVICHANGRVSEGPYVDGQRHGHWVLRRSVMGSVEEGSFVDGKMQGRWLEKIAIKAVKLLLVGLAAAGLAVVVYGLEQLPIWVGITGMYGLMLMCPMVVVVSVRLFVGCFNALRKRIRKRPNTSQAEPGKSSAEASSQPKSLELSKWFWPMLLALSFVPLLLMILMNGDDLPVSTTNFSKFIFLVFLFTVVTLMTGVASPPSTLRRILGAISILGIVFLFTVELIFSDASDRLEFLSWPMLIIGIFAGIAIWITVSRDSVF